MENPVKLVVDKTPQPPKKRKRKYVDILKVPLEKLTGWQEVNMDLNKLDAAMEGARLAKGDRIQQFFSRHKE